MPSANQAKKYRARIGQHPEPGGLLHPAKQIVREEIVFWQRIGELVRGPPN
ncbi:MAG: hypothetical protein ACLP00_08710 [Terracidiphilus sp.]